MVDGMAQIAIRLDDADLDRLDAAVARGRYATRRGRPRFEPAWSDCCATSENVRSRQYRHAYGAQRQDASAGRAGLALMAASVRPDETSGADHPEP